MTTLAKKISMVLLLACLALPAIVGCGVGTMQQENNRTISRVADYDARMMTDDLGLLSQTRRPWHGSRVPIK